EAENPRSRWIQGTAETGPLDAPCGLVTAGVSIHWMDPDVVMPHFSAALARGGRLAIVNMDSTYGEQEWRGEFLTLNRAFSPPTHYQTKTEVVRAPQTPGHLLPEGETAAPPNAAEQMVDDYPAMLANTSPPPPTTPGPRA